MGGKGVEEEGIGENINCKDYRDILGEVEEVGRSYKEHVRILTEKIGKQKAEDLWSQWGGMPKL